MVVLGIDPGLMGGLAFVESRDAELLALHDTPVIRVTKSKKEIDITGLAHLVQHWKAEAAFIEKVGAMPGQGVTSMFRFGMGYGILLGICGGLDIPITLVRPRTWQARMLRDTAKGTKGASVLRARQLYPDAELVTPRGRLLDGRADALLLARYGILHELPEGVTNG